MADKNPYDDLLKDVGQNTGGGGGGGNSLDDAQYDFTPEETQASSFALSDIFGQIPEQWALNAPDTITHITLPENQMYQAASMQALQYLQLIYGANLTPTLQAALIPNKEQREYAYSVLQQIAQQDIEIDPGAVGRGVYAQTRGADLDGANVDPELMSRVIADPKLLDTLDPGTRNAVIAQARAAGEMLQGTTGNTARQFYLITGQTASQNYDVFLSPDEKSALEGVLAYAQQGTPDAQGRGPNVAAAKAQQAGQTIGVSSIQNAGGPNPTIILDEKWAQARPVRAAAVMDYLRTQLPDVSFRVGEKGLVGKVLDVLGKPVDVISAIPAAGLGYIGEVSEELSDKIRYNDQDRARMAQQAAELERKLKNGNIAPEEWDDALRVIQHLKGNAEDQISYDFGEAIDLNLHPREAGFGFAENFTQALDLLPGDAGYDFAYGASGLAANIVFDPLNFALPAISGARAARHTVAGAAELPGKVDFALDAYRTMGNAPDATKVARASVADVLPAAPKPVKEVLGKGRYVILETIDDDIAKALKARGYNFGKVKLNGKDAVLVPKVTLEEGIHLAKEAGLQQFLSTEGLVDVGARTVRQVDEVLETSAKATDVVRFGDKTWGYRIGNKTTKLRPERIAGGYTKNWFYQKFVKTPEEWITTKPAREAVERLWTTKQAVGRDAFLARVQRLFNVDERVARVFANARTEDDMLMALQAAMTGNIKAPFNQAKTMGRLDSVLARLDEGDSLRAEGRVAESAPADFDLVPPRQLSEGDDLASIGQASDEFYYHMTRAENAPSIVRDRSLHPNASFYGMDPDFVPPEMRVPRAFVADSPEVAWNATKFVNDRMVIRVPKGEVDALGLRPDTAPVEGSFYATTDIPILNGEYLAEDGAWHKLIEPADARFAELELSRADDVAEAAFLRSINSGRDFNIALREVPDSRAWRRFLGREGRGSLGNALMSMAEFAERFPGNLIGQGPKRLARWLLTPEGRVAEKSAQQASAALGRWFRPHGAGSRIQFPWAARAEGELADTVIESADNIRNFLKTFAVPNAKAEKLVGRFLDLRNQRQSFEWTKDFWFTISDESPLLASTGREQIRDIWPDLFSERAPGYITKSKPGEFAKTEPTLFRVEVDENGNLFKSGVPVFTADMLHGLTLPNLDEVLELISFNRRMLRNWSKAGGARQPIAKGLMQGQRIWESINRFWKTSVLLAKMPLSLPLRIIGEEHLRIAAFDEASLVNHPVAWFRAARNTDEFALMAESSAAHLGLLGEQFLSRVRFARQGRHIVTIQDGDAYFRAASAKVAKLSKSPEVSRWYLDKTPQEALATMESGDGLARGSGDILGLWDELIDPKGVKDRIDAVRRAQLELEQLAAGNEKVKAAMKTGRMVNEAGDEVLAGTEEFSAELARMHATGEWKPTALELPASTAEFEFVNPQSFMADFRDKAFNYFYTKPDVALARAPLYRSIALREFKRLRSLGWSEGKALSSSQAYAARRVADTLYRIGETSGAHHWLRNIAPFFPAFQELTTTWLYRVPKAMGGGFWAPGAVRLLRKADVFFDFMKNLGVVQKDENGEWYVPIPGLGKLVSAIVGSPVPLEARASLSSFTGVLPDPFSGVQGLLPGLGAPSAAALTTAASHWDGVVDDFADYLLPFGREVSLGPALVDRLMMAAGVEPPWVFGSPDYQKTLKNYAIDDAIRMEMVKSPPPSRKEGESDQAFQKRYTTWSEGVLERAERRASLLYVVRGVSSVVLPFSASYDTKYDHEMQAIWTQLASFPDGGGDITGPMIDAFKAAHPEAVWYTNGKSINLSPDRNFSRTDSFAQEWTDQMRDTFTPAEFLRWSVGMQSYSVYANKLDRAYEALGDNAADVLLHGFQKFDTITPLRGEWQDYLDWTDSITPAGERSFHDLFKEWNKARGNDELNFTKEQELALEVKQVLGEASRLFIEGGVRDASYRDVSRVASQILSDADFPASSSKVGKGIDWWWKNVGDPYGEKVSALYDSLEETDDPFKRAGIYAQLREIANTAKGGTYGGVKMPTPEEVFFNNLSPEEQKARKLDWATLPVEWLTTFQMKQIGVKASPKLEDLATFINDNEVAFDKVVAENDISTSSNDYEALRRAFDLRAFDKAKDLGLVKEFALMRAPVYKRIDQFFSKEFSNTSWQRIVSLADDANRSIDAAPDGSITSTREAVSRWLVDQVRQVRSNDQRFNGIMERLEVAFAPGGKDRLSPDLLVLKLFFNYYGDSAPAYLYV